MDLKTALKNTQNIYPRFPREELEYLREHKDEAIPELLRRLDLAVKDDYTGNIEYAIFLLAEFRENKALPNLLEILRMDEDNIDWILGDTLTEGFCAVIASCAAKKDIPDIKDIVLDESLYEFARLCAVDALQVLYVEGVISRDEMVGFIGHISDKFGDDISFIESIAFMCAQLHFDEFTDMLKLYYAAKKFGENEDWETWQKWLAETTRENAVQKLKDEDRWCHYITDCCAAMDWWPILNNKADYDWGRKIGVNEPCPCGSGKKFKKCCK